MSVGLESRYPAEVNALIALFGPERIRACLARLDEIHEHSEACWQDYVQKLPARKVKYLLIAEAPPWTQEGRPLHVLDPASRPRTLLKALRSAFRLPLTRGEASSATLATLAEQGFVVLDSIPFAMDYTSKRGSTRYDALVALTFRTYLQTKIASSALTWAPDLKIAFSLRLNAAAILKAASKLETGKTRHRMSPEMIAVNEANYPDGAKLRRLFCLDANLSGHG